jgi:PAS domain S-box-containing protein
MPTIGVVRLLVVDNEQTQPQALWDALDREGYAVTCLSSAQIALGILREQAFDLALIDLVMDEMDGIAFLRASREIDPDLVGILMTTQGAAEQSIPAGPIDYIIKPFHSQALLTVLARAASVRRLRMENIHLQQAVGIYELSMVIQLTLDSDAVLQKVAEAALAHAQVSGVSVLLPIEDGRTLRVAVTRGENADRDGGKRISVDNALSLWVECNLKRVSRLNELADAEPALPLFLGSLPGSISVPMLAGGRFIGILNVTPKNPGRAPSQAQIKALNVLAGAAGAALEGASLLEQLRTAEQRYRSLSESAADIILCYELYPEAHVGYINPAAASITGYSPKEFYQNPELIKTLVHHEDRPAMEAVLRGERSTGDTVTVRCIHRNGTTVWIEQRMTLVRNPEGMLLAVECIGRDVTERKSLEEQLRQSQKMEAVGLMAGGVAHDFNNLLTVIMGYSDLILSDDVPAASCVARIGQIRKAAERAAALTGQLLAFGRKQPLRFQVLDLNEVIRESLTRLRRLIGEDVDLCLNLDADLESVKADSGHIEQILMNLAVNARHAMAQGGRITIETRNVNIEGSVGVRVRMDDSGPYVMLSVIDTGCGMDAATQARIFEPFYTTKKLGNGTGLGLSIVYGIVKQFGGYVRVLSQPGQGARFDIFLPGTAKGEGSPTEVSPEPAEAEPVGPGMILVVEDDLAISHLIDIILRTEGYTVLIAHSGSEALRMSEENKGEIGLILSDLVLPGTSGVKLGGELAELNAGAKLLYMSGYSSESVARCQPRDLAIPFLPKPFTPASLIRKIRETMKR